MAAFSPGNANSMPEQTTIKQKPSCRSCLQEVYVHGSKWTLYGIVICTLSFSVHSFLSVSCENSCRPASYYDIVKYVHMGILDSASSLSVKVCRLWHQCPYTAMYATRFCLPAHEH